MDKLREEFEKWWKDENYDKQLINIHHVMVNRIKKGMLAAWQASRASIVVELPDSVGIECNVCADVSIKRCEESIRSIGLSIKGE